MAGRSYNHHGGLLLFAQLLAVKKSVDENKNCWRAKRCQLLSALSDVWHSSGNIKSFLTLRIYFPFWDFGILNGRLEPPGAMVLYCNLLFVIRHMQQ